MNPSEFRIVVMTHPRAVETLDRSISSLKASVNREAMIKVMPDEGPRLGCFKHYDRCLRAAIKFKSAKYVAVFPDDMLYSEGWVQQAVKRLTKDVGYAAMFTPQGLGRRLAFAKGWNQSHGGWASSWGGCYVFRADVAREIIKHERYLDHLVNYAANKQIDHIIPEVVHQMGLKQYWIAPSVCEHIGMTSTIGHKHTEHENPFRP